MFSPGESEWPEEPSGLQSMGLQRLYKMAKWTNFPLPQLPLNYFLKYGLIIVQDHCSDIFLDQSFLYFHIFKINFAWSFLEESYGKRKEACRVSADVQYFSNLLLMLCVCSVFEKIDLDTFMKIWLKNKNLISTQKCSPFLL